MTCPSPSIAPIQARQYQTDLVERARDRIRWGVKRLVIQLPTGGGKTIIASLIIRAAVTKGKRVLFLAHRRELINQTSAKLDLLGVDHGIIQANHWRHRPAALVQVASIQTLIRRDVESPQLIFIDECHRARSASYEKIIQQFPDAVLVGLTATPIRGDGQGLGLLFEEMVLGPSVGTLTDMGFLVPTRVFTGSVQADLRDVGKSHGEYRNDQLSRVMCNAVLVGDIVETWKRHGVGRQTICFAVSVVHSKFLRDSFLDAGIIAEHLDGTTPIEDRERMLRNIENGNTQILCSVGVLAEGWDAPIVSCAILARPTCSMGLFLQMSGRILRPFSGKENALILDHAQNVKRHGLIDDDRVWTLKTTDPNTAATRERGDTDGITGRAVDVVPGELQEVIRERQIKLFNNTPPEVRRRVFDRYVKEGVDRGYKAGYAGAKYREMFGEWPPRTWQDLPLKAEQNA